VKILAVDPGPSTSGYVVWSPRLNRVIGAGTEIENDRLRREILPALVPGASRGDVGVRLAIEKVACYGRPVGSPVLDTVFFSGRLAEAWYALTGHEAQLVPFGEVALHFCHSRHAKESHVRQVLLDRFGGKGTRANRGPFYGVSGHAWSAAALGIYVMDHLNPPAARDDAAGTLELEG
jgi:hypothetical protein